MPIKDKKKQAIYNREYYKKHGKRIRARRREWYKENSETDKVRSKKWKKENRERWNAYRNEYNKKHSKEMSARQRNRRTTDPSFRLMQNIRNAVSKSLKRRSYIGDFRHLSYNLEMLVVHLQKHFKKGMTWENYGRGGWHVDHIIPISSFKITSTCCIGFKKCWALENLQPLWEEDNLSKSNK